MYRQTQDRYKLRKILCLRAAIGQDGGRGGRLLVISQARPGQQVVEREWRWGNSTVRYLPSVLPAAASFLHVTFICFLLQQSTMVIQWKYQVNLVLTYPFISSLCVHLDGESETT